MTVWQSLSGMIKVELTGAALYRSIQDIIARDISIFDLECTDEITAKFCIRRQDLKKTEKICRKNGDSLRICSRLGSFFLFSAVRARPLLLCGVFLIVFLTFFLPTRVFFVLVEGNSRIPERQILEAADSVGIGFGAARKDVRSEKIKNALLSALTQLQWAGVNTRGCVAVITVREQPEQVSRPVDSGTVCSIAADRDGVIEFCEASRGTLLCSPGQAVRKGDILISGYTDCGICIRAEHASGEVYAVTNRSASATAPIQFLRKGGVLKSRRCFSLLIGKKRINLYKSSRIWNTECDRIYKEYYVELPGGFRLPIGIACERITARELAPGQADIAETDVLLRQFAREYILNHMNAGTILREQEIFSDETGLRILHYDSSCREMIGIPHIEQIGENNG